jgi:ribosomal protein S18 acetylase RimI-like enzyme
VPSNPDLQIGPIGVEAIPALVAIHRAEIGYSLNSKLGAEHLARLYRFVGEDPDSLIAMARFGSTPVGLVIATLDPSRLMRKVMASIGPWQWLRLAARVLVTPSALIEWLEGISLGRSASFRGEKVAACLLAIAVAGNMRGRGVGKALVHAVDDFCRRAGQIAYRLDTRIANVEAQRFYRGVGFVNVERRGRNLIWVRELSR